MRITYFCEYCPKYSRDVLTKEEAIEHEEKCLWNPSNRHCLSCRNHGTIHYWDTDSTGKEFKNHGNGCTKGYADIRGIYISNCKYYESWEEN